MQDRVYFCKIDLHSVQRIFTIMIDFGVQAKKCKSSPIYQSVLVANST